MTAESFLHETAGATEKNQLANSACSTPRAVSSLAEWLYIPSIQLI